MVASSRAVWAPKRSAARRVSLASPAAKAAVRSTSTASPAFSASQPRPAAHPFVEVGVAPGSSHPLAETQVRPRAIGDGSPGAQQDVELGIVDVDAVGHKDMGAEHAQVVEVLHGSAAGAGEVRRHVGIRRREVEGQARAGVGGHPARRDHEVVGHQVVTDEGHPAGDRWWPAVSSSTSLAVEDGGDVAGEGQASRVRSPRAKRSPHPDRS